MNELLMLQKANKVYNSLEDAESKDIFESRLLYSVTEDIKHIHNMVKKHTNFIAPLPSNEKISSDLVFIENSCKTGKAIIIYGAGKVGRIIKDLLKNIKIECFSDINIDLQSSGVNGIPVISPQTLVSKYNKDAVMEL